MLRTMGLLAPGMAELPRQLLLVQVQGRHATWASDGLRLWPGTTEQLLAVARSRPWRELTSEER